MSETTFGTDGWRGIIARDFTFERLVQVASAVIRYLQDENLARRGLVIGYDRRFQSRSFAEEVADTAATYGLNVWLMQDFAPSPAVSWAVRHKNAGAGIMITASHNPPQYSGLKLKEYFGGSARPSTTAKIEYLLSQAALPHRGASPGRIETIDGRSAYQAALRAFINVDYLRTAACPIGIDVMHGATGDLLAAPLTRIIPASAASAPTPSPHTWASWPISSEQGRQPWGWPPMVTATALRPSMKTVSFSVRRSCFPCF
jgi:phosphomannomutase